MNTATSAKLSAPTAETAATGTSGVPAPSSAPTPEAATAVLGLGRSVVRAIGAEQAAPPKPNGATSGNGVDLRLASMVQRKELTELLSSATPFNKRNDIACAGVRWTDPDILTMRRGVARCDEDTRYFIARSLTGHPSDVAASLLAELMLQDPSRRVRDIAALAMLGSTSTAARAAFLAVGPQHESDIRLAAAQTLGSFVDDDAARQLRNLAVVPPADIGKLLRVVDSATRGLGEILKASGSPVARAALEEIAMSADPMLNPPASAPQRMVPAGELARAFLQGGPVPMARRDVANVFIDALGPAGARIQRRVAPAAAGSVASSTEAPKTITERHHLSVGYLLLHAQRFVEDLARAHAVALEDVDVSFGLTGRTVSFTTRGTEADTRAFEAALEATVARHQ